jgi:hypothetical protein
MKKKKPRPPTYDTFSDMEHRAREILEALFKDGYPDRGKMAILTAAQGMLMGRLQQVG